MMPRLLLLLFVLPLLLNAQTPPRFTTEQMRDDFRVYRESLEEAHPGLYWYRTKTEMDSVFDAVEASLNQSLTEGQFYALLATATARIGCLHTNISRSKTWHEENITIRASPFPFEVKLDGNKMFIYQNLSEATEIPDRSEIISINGMQVNQMIPFLLDRISNDGYGKEWSSYALERAFRYYYHVYYGEPEEFRIMVQFPEGQRTSVTVPGRLEADRIKTMKERYSYEPEHVISLNYLDSVDAALLRITNLDNWKVGDRKYKFLKVLRKSMNDVLKSGVPNLIIDLGDRGGGNEIWGLELLSYFLEEPYTAYSIIEFKTMKFGVSKDYSTNSWMEYNAAKALLRFEKTDSTLHLKNYRGLRPYPPKKERYNGNLYLLISGSTASATSDFAAWVDDLELGTIVGSETGGAYEGNTSNWEFTVILPNSEFQLTVPLGRYFNNVRQKEKGRGVLPDVVVPFTIEDKLNDHDPQLEYVVEFIRSLNTMK